MDDPRPEKVAVVTEVGERFDAAEAALLTEYRGLSVSALAELRGALRHAGGTYKIYKNTLVRIAARQRGIEIDDLLTGPTAIAFVEGDAAGVAKALRDYARGNPALVVKGGLLGRSVLGADDVTALADLPSRDQLLAEIAGLFAAPAQHMASLLDAVQRGFSYALSALIEAGGAPGAPVAADAPAAPEVATDAPVDAPAASEAIVDEGPAAPADVSDAPVASEADTPTASIAAAIGEAPSQPPDAPAAPEGAPVGEAPSAPVAAPDVSEGVPLGEAPTVGAPPAPEAPTDVTEADDAIAAETATTDEAPPAEAPAPPDTVTTDDAFPAEAPAPPDLATADDTPTPPATAGPDTPATPAETQES